MLFLFPLDFLDEIWDLIESVSEGFPTYSHISFRQYFIRFGTILYKQIICLPMGTNCALLIADLTLFCYERDFMASLSYNEEAEIIKVFCSTSR